MIGAVVLAAGRGRRFGYAPKLLSPIGRRTAIEHTLDAVSHGPARPVIVVTGRRHAAVRSAVSRQRVRTLRHVRVVRNRDYKTGMAGSLRTGLGALPRHCDAALVCLGDMPLLTREDVHKLCRAWRPGLDYVRAGSVQRPGHPVVIGRSLFPALAALSGDRGAQPVLDTVPGGRAAWLAGSGSTLDIDTPRALRALLQRQRRKNVRRANA